MTTPHQYADDYLETVKTVPLVARPTSSSDLASVLNEGYRNPRHGLIDLSLMPLDAVHHTVTHLQGHGPEPDEVLYVGYREPTERVFSVNSRQNVLKAIAPSNVVFINIAGRGNHYEGAQSHQDNANYSLIHISNGIWQNINGSWRETGFYGHGYVAVVGCHAIDFGTGILGYGTGGFLVAHNVVDRGSDWSTHGLSGISFVRLNGNDVNMDLPHTPWAGASYVYLGNTVTDIRQRVNSTAIGQDKPTDGNGLIIGDSENARGSFLIERNEVKLCDGAGINVYRGPVGGGVIQGNVLEHNWMRREYPTVNHDPNLWGGQILLQREPNDRVSAATYLSDNTITGRSYYGPATEDVKVRNVEVVQLDTPAPEPEPEPEPTPVPVPEPEPEPVSREEFVQMVLDMDALKRRLDKVELRQDAYASEYNGTEDLLLDLAQHTRHILTSFEEWNGGEIVGE